MWSTAAEIIVCLSSPRWWGFDDAGSRCYPVRKMSSYATLLFYMTHLYVCGSWLRPSESRGFVFASEGCCALMIVREYVKSVAGLSDDIMNGIVLDDLAPLAHDCFDVSFVPSVSQIM